MAQCLSPFFIKDGNKKSVLVPCSKCLTCRKRYISSWSFRVMEECKTSLSAHFITLTYDDSAQKISRNGLRTLCKRDLQLFFKRLRRVHSKMAIYQEKSIKYFAVGEYGGKIGRPHYHCIVFNADIGCIQQAWSHSEWICNIREAKRPGKNQRTHIISASRVWKHNGFIHLGNGAGVTPAAIGYCMKYMLNAKDYDIDKDDDREKVFRVMSKGIGIGYLEEKNIAYHMADQKNRMYVNLEDGKKASMPRYYKDRIYTVKEREEIASHSRNKFAEDILKDLFREYKNDPDYVKSYHKKKRDRKEAVEASRQQQVLLTKKNRELCYQ